MQRVTLVKWHLALASVFLPFLMIIPLSGGLDLVGREGKVEKTEVFKIPGPVPPNPDEFFREQFKARGLDFQFEYIRISGNDYTFRPSSRVHYMASKAGDEITVYKVEPDWLKRLMEIHKGHGPRLIKWVQIAFALSIILVSFSGVYLAVTVPAYRRVMLSGFAAGLVVLILGLVA